MSATVSEPFATLLTSDQEIGESIRAIRLVTCSRAKGIWKTTAVRSRPAASARARRTSGAASHAAGVAAARVTSPGVRVSGEGGDRAAGLSARSDRATTWSGLVIPVPIVDLDGSDAE